jgi:hypothetical protein
MNKKARRIIENIYDVILKTSFYEEAKNELDKDLYFHNIAVDREKGIIQIQDSRGKRTLYTITIKEGK